MRIRNHLMFVLVVGALAFAGCGPTDDDKGASDAGADTAQTGDAADGSNGGQPVTWAEIQIIFEDRNCSGCHGTVPDSYESVVDHWVETDAGRPLEQMMQVNHRVDEQQATAVLQWLDDGYPKN